MEEEIIQDYSASLRQALLDYILLDPTEWKRLNIQTYPIKFPTIMIRAPVTWHASKIKAQQLISRSLFIGNFILLRLRDLWLEQ